MKEQSYKVGTRMSSWEGGATQSLTFIVTEDCNLRCKYCYITHKASNKKMNFEVAKKFIDYVLSGEMVLQDGVTLDFIGGEPLLEIDLIDQICDYFKLKTYLLGIQWYWKYRISICTNGVNYSDDRIQKFIEKNKEKIGITITIDGIKEKHDLQRVFPDGSGSYDVVKKNVDIWKHQFAASTKVTFASDDLKYLKESIIELWNEGIPEIAANVVFEAVWNDCDDKILEEQLVELADYILEHRLYDKYVCTFFDDTIGEPYTEELLKQTSCGAGKMLAVGVDGKLYPCMRYCGYSLNNRKPYIIGDVDHGIDFDKVRPFETVTYKMQSDKECLNCPVATGCSFCQGFNYDEADTETNFQRAKYICKMHKARVRANNYYFAKLYNLHNVERRNWNNEKLTMNFILSDDFVKCCMGIPKRESVNDNCNTMPANILLEGLAYAQEHCYKPVFIHSKYNEELIEMDEFQNFRILHIVPVQFYEKAIKIYKDVLPVFEVGDIENHTSNIILDNVIFNIHENDIRNLSYYIKKLWKYSNRININILGLDNGLNVSFYQEELEKIKGYIVKNVESEQTLRKEINILTDILMLQTHENCGAGDNSITLAPDGNFYICPAFYLDQHSDTLIGNIENRSIDIKNSHLYTLKYAPICNECDVFHCGNCIYHNKKNTTEVNVSSSIQCKKSWIERSVSFDLQEELREIIHFGHKLEKWDVKDPIDNLRQKLNNTAIGYYPLHD